MERAGKEKEKKPRPASVIKRLGMRGAECLSSGPQLGYMLVYSLVLESSGAGGRRGAGGGEGGRGLGWRGGGSSCRAHARDFTPTHATVRTTPTPPPCFFDSRRREGSDRSERIGLCRVSSGSPLFKEGGSNARMNYACIDVDHPRPRLFSREHGVVLVLGWQAVRSRGGKENEKGGKGKEKVGERSARSTRTLASLVSFLSLSAVREIR